MHPLSCPSDYGDRANDYIFIQQIPVAQGYLCCPVSTATTWASMTNTSSIFRITFTRVIASSGRIINYPSGKAKIDAEIVLTIFLHEYIVGWFLKLSTKFIDLQRSL